MFCRFDIFCYIPFKQKYEHIIYRRYSLDKSKKTIEPNQTGREMDGLSGLKEIASKHEKKQKIHNKIQQKETNENEIISE